MCEGFEKKRKEEKKVEFPWGCASERVVRKKNSSSSSRAFSTAFSATLPSSATSLSTENNENIDPRENDGALSGRFPGPGICTSYIIVVAVIVVVDNGCECFGESRAAFNARFFGRLLSKQTFRRGPRSFFHRVEAHVRFIRPRVTILRAIERRVESSTFFRLAAIDKYSTCARYVRKQVARQPESSRVLRGTCASKTFMIERRLVEQKRFRSNREILKNSENKLHGKNL